MAIPPMPDINTDNLIASGHQQGGAIDGQHGQQGGEALVAVGAEFLFDPAQPVHVLFFIEQEI